jgi:hypothetical protein
MSTNRSFEDCQIYNLGYKEGFDDGVRQEREHQSWAKNHDQLIEALEPESDHRT